VTTIGRSMAIRGELRGQEDLSIDGTVEGAIELREQDLTITQNARVSAKISAKNVVILGEVVGTIAALERVEIQSRGKVRGEVSSPEVVITVARLPTWILLLLLLPPTLLNLWAWNGLMHLSRSNRHLLVQVGQTLHKNGEDLAQIQRRLADHQQQIGNLGKGTARRTPTQGDSKVAPLLAFDPRPPELK
jgi:hypothetical protein